MKKIITILTILILLISILNVSAAASYSFNFVGPTQANKEDTVTLTITANGLTGKVGLSSTNATLSDTQKWVEKNSVSVTAKITSFPATITATPQELTDNDYNIVSLSSKTVTISEIPKPSEPKQEEISTQPQTTTPPPTSNNNQHQSDQSSSSSKPYQGTTTTTTGKQAPDTSVKINQELIQPDENKSSNNYLKSLNVSAGTITPAFDREIEEYTINNIIEKEIEIMAEAEDERAIVSGVGTIALNQGENIINISVTAQNESVRNYRLIINKKQEITQSDLRLQDLEIKKINENGEFTNVDINFDKDIFKYKINVENNITDLDIIPTIEKEGIIVETKGGNNLNEGENDVSIILTNNENKEEKTIYSIKALRDAKAVLEEFQPVEKDNHLGPIIAIVVVIVSIIGIMIFRRIKNITKK